MPPKKSNNQPTVVHEGGGIPFFQIFIFLIATVSMAMNVAIITGQIPIKGKLNSSKIVYETPKKTFDGFRQLIYNLDFETSV